MNNKHQTFPGFSNKTKNLTHSHTHMTNVNSEKCGV